MSCNICQTEFSFFTKEVGCPGCGYSCCSKCLKYRCEVPNKGMKKVCGRCYNKSKKEENSDNNTTMSSNEQEERIAPVDITHKLDSLENPVKPPIVMYKNINHWDKFKNGLEPVDQMIVDRLRKLREEDKAAPLTDDEIRRRLALLKEEDPIACTSRRNQYSDICYDEATITKGIIAKAVLEGRLEAEYENLGKSKETNYDNDEEEEEDVEEMSSDTTDSSRDDIDTLMDRLDMKDVSKTIFY